MKQVRRIISEFVEYYNNQRMHQGICKIPDAEIVVKSGVIKKKQILSGSVPSLLPFKCLKMKKIIHGQIL